MNTIFDFHPAIKAERRSSLEEKIKEDIEFEEVKPCHGDSLRVSVMPADHPLNLGIKVNTQCTCGKIIKSFIGSDDGSTMRTLK